MSLPDTTTASVVADEPFDLVPDELGRLTLKRPGKDDVKDVRVRRAFPWSKPEQFISVRGSDGKEILLVEDAAKLPAAVRSTIAAWLSRNTFIPTVKRVKFVDTSHGYQQWDVDTDRGPASFRVQEREDVRFLPDGRFLIKDADGNVYLMPSLADLDEVSRKAAMVMV
jgi:hypothetical protein